MQIDNWNTKTYQEFINYLFSFKQVIYAKSLFFALAKFKYLQKVEVLYYSHKKLKFLKFFS